MKYSNHKYSAANIISDGIKAFLVYDEWGDGHIPQIIYEDTDTSVFELIAKKLREDDYWVEITEGKDPDFIGQTLCKLSWVDENWKLQHIYFFKLGNEPCKSVCELRESGWKSED